MQVVEREVLADGRVRLLVQRVSASTFEEWIINPIEPEAGSESLETTANKQPANATGDSAVHQPQPGWEAIAEYNSGCIHGKHDAANNMLPMCKEANCSYTRGYLDGYPSIQADSQQPLPTPKAIEWKVVYDPRWDLYQVWIGERCLLEKATSYLEGETIAQKYAAAEKLRRQHRELVMASFAA